MRKQTVICLLVYHFSEWIKRFILFIEFKNLLFLHKIWLMFTILNIHLTKAVFKVLAINQDSDHALYAKHLLDLELTANNNIMALSNDRQIIRRWITKSKQTMLNKCGNYRLWPKHQLLTAAANLSETFGIYSYSPISKPIGRPFLESHFQSLVACRSPYLTGIYRLFSPFTQSVHKYLYNSHYREYNEQKEPMRSTVKASI